MSRITRTIALAVLVILALATLAALLNASAARAAGTPEQKCQEARYKEAGKYVACQQKVMAKLYGGKSVDLQEKLAKCMTKYTGKWTKIQAKASGTGATCDTARFVDNGNGTVTDWLTGLQWEQKTDDASVHDKDNVYSWSAAPPFTAADGTAFTSFLASLNSGGCFAGQCDWRLPAIAELQTLLLAPYPCGTTPCIDPIFGPTASDYFYWSATTDAYFPHFAWYVYFDVGAVFGDGGKGYNLFYVRAVRSGP